MRRWVMVGHSIDPDKGYENKKHMVSLCLKSQKHLYNCDRKGTDIRKTNYDHNRRGQNDRIYLQSKRHKG